MEGMIYFMKESDYKEFIKRYDQFKKNNLPTPFWDEERQTLEYVYFYNGKSIYNSKKAKGELEVYPNLMEALSDIAFTGFYYPFTGKHMVTWRENGKLVQKAVVEHDHAHSFEEVVKALYTSPESFYIASDEEQYYSKQELIYLRRVQKYLLLIGMKDLEVGEVSNSRFQNKIHAKYENVFIYRFSDDALKDILNGKRNFRVINWYPQYVGDKTFKPKEYQALITDQEDNFKMFVEFTHEEVKHYRDIKNLYKNNDLKDDDLVILCHFKILESFSDL